MLAVPSLQKNFDKKSRHEFEFYIGCQAIKLTYRADELIDACKSFLCLDAAFEFILVTFLVPDLEPLVVLAHKMRANLVVNNTVQASSSILWWVSYVNAALSSFFMRYTRWCHLIWLELYGEKICKVQSFQIIREHLKGFFFAHNFSFGLKVARFAAINFNKAVKNALG